MKAIRCNGRALHAELGVIEDRVADVAGGEGGAVGERVRGGYILAEFEDEAVGAVVGLRAEESGDHDAGWDGAVKFAIGFTRIRKIEVVHDEAAFGGGIDEFGNEPGGVGSGGAQRGENFGRGVSAVEADLFELFEGEILRARDGGQAVHGTFPRAADGAAREDETEAGVETDVDAADDRVRALGQEVGEGDVDAIARCAVDDPGGATESAIGGRGLHGAVAGFGGTNPALFGFWGGDVERVARVAQGVYEFVEENAFDAVVVGEEELHDRKE